MQEKEQKFLFCPEDGNVAFASAYDCWSFTLPSFLPAVAKKLGMNAKALSKFMWGQFYYDTSNKSVSKNPPSSSTTEMFV